MTNGSDSRPVVYYYADPAFAWDVGPVLADLERRGFRVVTGDNADELLFLLQMGRPAAIIYTVGKAEARAHGSFHMVASRAVDMLVPVFVVGPDNPRDGVILRYPAGGAVEESHAPFHALGDLIERFDAEPPSTASRPPMAVANQTFGKGRTMMSWRRDGPIVTPADYGASLVEPSSKPPAPALAADGRQDDREERKTLPAKKKHAAQDEAVRGAVPNATPTISAISAPPAAPVQEQVRAVRAEPEPPFERPPQPHTPRPVAWKIPAVLAGGVAIGVAGLVVYLATAPRPAMEAAKPAPATAPRAAAAAPRPTNSAPPDATDGATPASAAAETPPAGAADDTTDGTTGGATARRHRAPGAPQIEEALLSDASGTVRFPGHFREESAIFWFAGDWEERRFLDLVRSLGPTAKIRVSGHATGEELAAGLNNLALSRAWAVEKYLVRQGIADERIETEKGALVTSGADLDERGWPRNRWVDVRFD
jgi:hypothetical protein